VENEAFDNPFALPSPARDEAPVPPSAPRATPLETPLGTRSATPLGAAGDGTAAAVPVQPALGFDGTPVPASGPYDTLGRSIAPRPRARLSAGAVAVVTAVALLVGGLGGFLGSHLGSQQARVVTNFPAAPGGPAPAAAPSSVAGIAAAVLPSVVSINVHGSAEESTASGFVLSADGYILTNNHVVAHGAGTDGRIDVVFADGGHERATIVGRTADYDLAVIRVTRTGLTPLVLGDSDKARVGDPVIVIGAPLGLEGTVTTGIVSALNRPVTAGDWAGSSQTAFINAIQTDAAINPGNSGGPLVNTAGQVIGINSAIATQPGITGTPGNIGLGFAIPSNQARRTAAQLIQTGTATYPIVGVFLDSRYEGEGVQVLTTAPAGGEAPVRAGGPADRAGIKPGDIVLSIDGRPVTHPDELIVAIRAKAPGDSVLLKVRSGTAERDVRVVLDEATSG
jgi:putative serine protease PepD